MRAAPAEIDHRAPFRGAHDPRGLRCDDRGEADLVESERLDQLRVADRGDDLHDRLAGEERRALLKRVDVALEAEPGELLQERIGKALGGEVGDVVRLEAKRLDRVKEIVDAACDEEIALLRQPPDEEREDSLVFEPELPIGPQHRQLVEVGEKSKAHAETVRPKSRFGTQER